MQAAGSTAGEPYRENGSDRAERAMSMESAASASLPTTAIPKGALLCCWAAQQDLICIACGLTWVVKIIACGDCQSARTCVCRLQAPQGFGCIWPMWLTIVPVVYHEPHKSQWHLSRAGQGVSQQKDLSLHLAHVSHVPI